MSEDSIASDSRTEAPSLPPRKRLLAGLKQNGWSSPSSSSCAVPPLDHHQVIETLALPKQDELDQSSFVDAPDALSLQSPLCAAESVDSHHRKSKRPRASSLLKNSSKKRKKPSSDEESVKDTDVNNSSVVDDKAKASDGMLLPAVESIEGGEDADTVVDRVSSEAEKQAIATTERDSQVQKKENGEALVEDVIAMKPASNPSGLVKDEEELTCDEANNPSRNRGNKAKKGESKVAPSDEVQKPRRNPNRQHASRSKDADQKKQDLQQGRNIQTSLPLADEELARQLHRAMNSSPRIARCLSPKEERPLLSPSRKHYPGN